MALARWSCLRIIQEFAKRTGLPRPTSLNAAEIAANPVFQDMIDIVDDVVQQLMIRICPEEVITTSLIKTNAATLMTNLTFTNGSSTVLGNLFVPAHVGRKIRNTQYNCTFTILSRDAVSATLNDTYYGPTDSADAQAYVFNDVINLPADFYKPVMPPGRFITTRFVDMVPPPVFQASKFNAGGNSTITTGEPKIVTLVAGGTGYDRALQYGPIDTVAYNLEIQYYKRITTFREVLAVTPTAADTTYSLIPAEHQGIIIDAAIREYYAFQAEDERYKFADAHMREKLSMMGEDGGLRTGFSLRPHINKSRRRLFTGHSNFQRLCAKYDLGDWFDILGDD